MTTTDPTISTARRAAAQDGFTLIEIMVVVAVMALVFQIVTTNLGAMLPASAMDSTAAELVSKLDFLRSESRLQSKTHKLEIDLGEHRYRMLLPPEDRLTSSEEVKSHFDLGWTDLNERVRFNGCALASGRILREGKFVIAFDENGFTSDLSLFLVHVADEEMVWTIQLRGLTGQTEIVKDFDGKIHPLTAMEEGRF